VRDEVLARLQAEFPLATPHIAGDGEQRLLPRKSQLDWTPAAVANTSEEFEALALRFNDGFHKRLEDTAQA
jgi:hypothetical protein